MYPDLESFKFKDVACLFFNQEDPRLKYPVHMRNKNSMEPGDLGPLPVSTVTIRPTLFLPLSHKAH